jgi:putative ABC transport system ATP-binding protein
MRIDGRELHLIYDMNKDEETYALRNVEITILPHGLTGITGPSGSGKSSLLYVLSGLKKPTSGTVYYDDADIESLEQERKAQIRKEKFGFIFQKHCLLEYLTILDNVLIPVNQCGPDYKARAQGLLDQLGIRHLAGKKPYQLSEGQKQRAAVARALINEPEVIFADEPTASLDRKNAMEVMEILNDIKGNVSILVVTHDTTLLEKADGVIEMWDGCIKAPRSTRLYHNSTK